MITVFFFERIKMTDIKKDISLPIKRILSRFENDTKKYLNSFDDELQITFTNNEETRKKLLRNYKRFLIVIKNHNEALESVAAKLSYHICASDDQCNKELTEELIKIFNCHEIFQNSVIKFMENCDCAFLDGEKGFNHTQLANNSRELFIAIKNYSQNI